MRLNCRFNLRLTSPPKIVDSTNERHLAVYAWDTVQMDDCCSQACTTDFGLTISLKKTNVLGRYTADASPVITIDDYELCLPVRKPRLHNHCQPLPGRRDRQVDWDGRCNSCSSQTHGSSVDRPQARHGLHMPGRKEGSTDSIWKASASWAYPDKIKVYNADVLSRACRPSMYTLLTYNAYCDGWVMSSYEGWSHQPDVSLR